MAFRGPRDQGITSYGSSRSLEDCGVGPSPAAISCGSQAETTAATRGPAIQDGNLLSSLSQRVPSVAEKMITREMDVYKGKNQQRRVVVLSRHLL